MSHIYFYDVKPVNIFNKSDSTNECMICDQHLVAHEKDD